MSTTSYVIGYIDRISAKDERHFGQLKPLCYVDPNSSLAEMIPPKDLIEDFPNRGSISWVDIPATAVVGSIWEFRISEQQYETGNRMHDRYKVAHTPLVPYEVLDTRDLRRVECAERFFSTSGLQLRFKPNDRVLLRIDEETFIGPVRLVPNHAGLLTVEVVRHGQPLPPLSVHNILQNRLIRIEFDGQERTIVSAAATLGTPEYQVDWSPDELVLKRVLRQAKEAGRIQIAEVTNKSLDAITKLFGEIGSPLEKYRFARAHRIVSAASVVQHLLPSIIADILEIPEVKVMLDRETKAARQHAEQGVYAELQELVIQVRALEEQKVSLQKQVQESETEHQSKLAALEQGFQDRIRRLSEHPGEFLADVSVLRTVLGSLTGKAQEPQTAGTLDPAPFIVPSQWKNRGRTIESLQELKKSAQSHRGNVSPEAMRQLIGSLGAGLVPIVAGPSARRCLTAVGNCIAGGRSIVVPISPNFTEAVDMFGRIQDRRFVPCAGELANVVLEAHKNNELFLVILDGINRAATESYLLPLLNLYWATQHGPGETLSLFSNAALINNDPYSQLNQLTWPRNVLLAGTAVHGPSVLPLTSDILESCTIILSQVSDEAAGPAVNKPDLTSVSFDKWPVLLGGTKELSTGLQSLVSGMKLESDLNADMLRRLNSSICKWSGDNSSVSADDILKITLLPTSVANGRSDDLSRLLGKKDTKADDLAYLQQNLVQLLTWK